MSDSRTFAVVGGGLAGAKAVEALRADGFDGRLVLFGAEAYRPYERPPLSKGYLQGKAERDAAFVHPEGWYAEHDVDLRLGTEVAGLDRHAHELIAGHGDPVHYDKLLLTTGASPRPGPQPTRSPSPSASTPRSPRARGSPSGGSSATTSRITPP